VKKRNKNQKITKGAPSAVLLSILIHAGLFLVAGAFVVFTVLPKEEVKFEPPPPVKHPKMPLKKPQVRTKKPSKPKSTAKLTAVVQKVDLKEIAFPDLPTSGMGAGIGGSAEGVGFMDLPEIGEESLFGTKSSIGNDFEGQLFDLKKSRDGGFISMDGDEFRAIIRKYVMSGWNSSVLSRFFRSEKLYTTHFMVPTIPEVMAPDQFGVPETEGYFFFLKYQGKLVYPEDITFRFWGIGDAYMMVNVDGKDIFIDAWNSHLNNYFDWWRPKASHIREYQVCNRRLVPSDWVTLKAGESVDMKVIMGVWKYNYMSCVLLVEEKGKKYPTRPGEGGPIFPAFKTEEFSEDLLDAIMNFLPENEACLTNGPVFRDY